jgi:hypothetical protein
MASSRPRAASPSVRARGPSTAGSCPADDQQAGGLVEDALSLPVGVGVGVGAFGDVGDVSTFPPSTIRRLPRGGVDLLQRLEHLDVGPPSLAVRQASRRL